jgi:hypothetical protein
MLPQHYPAEIWLTLREFLDYFTGLRHVADVLFANATLERAQYRMYAKHQPVGCHTALHPSQGGKNRLRLGQGLPPGDGCLGPWADGPLGRHAQHGGPASRMHYPWRESKRQGNRLPRPASEEANGVLNEKN